MATEAERAMLRADLGHLSPPDSVARFMDFCLDTAAAQIEARGVTLNHSDIGDMQLVEMYAAWLYRHRDAGTGMPDMVRAALYNRMVHPPAASPAAREGGT